MGSNRIGDSLVLSAPADQPRHERERHNERHLREGQTFGTASRPAAVGKGLMIAARLFCLILAQSLMGMLFALRLRSVAASAMARCDAVCHAGAARAQR